MTADKPIFTENQYLGREWIPLTIRLMLSMVCFLIYTFTANNDQTADVLAIVGFVILFASIVMGFLLHFRTQIINKSILLNGLWTTRLVKIDLNSIVKAEIGEYSRYLVNNPVYNLHTKGTIRFYTAGKQALYLTDRDGLVYIIGSQCANEFLRALQSELQ